MKDFILTDCAHATGYKQLNRHTHMAHEIIYIKSGIIRLTVGGNSREVRENSIIFLSCLEEHSIDILSEKYERYFLNLLPKKLDKLINDPRLVSICKNRPPDFNHCIEAPLGTEDIFHSIIEEYNQLDSFSEEIIAARLRELLIKLFRQSSDSFPLPNQSIKSEIFEVQRYIEKNFKKEVLISDIAEQFYINKYYLTHSFKELTGYSPKQYLLLNRLSYAKELLINSSLDISQIAEKSGFYDSNSFIRSFKNEYAITPNVYRKA